jgi:predicted O-linked N-acetylglucosamine transferase (SPINDLY family)
MGLLALQVKEHTVGLAHLKQAITINPLNRKYWHSYIDALGQNGLYELAQQVSLAARKAKGLEEENTHLAGQDPLSSITNKIQSPQDYYQQRAYEECEKLARHLLAINPNDGQSWKWLGLSLQQQQRLPEAVAALNTASERLPDEAETQGLYAAALHCAGRLEEASFHYRTAIRLDNGNDTYQYNLGVIWYNLGQLVEAEQCFKNVLSRKPAAIEVLMNLALTLLAQNRNAEAEVCLRNTIAQRPSHPEAHHYLSIALKHQGRLEEAKSASGQALALNLNYADAYDTQGAILFEQGKLQEAESCFEKAIACQPAQPKSYNNLGTVLQLQRKIVLAEEYYRKAIALDPNFVDAHINLGINLQSQSRIKEAEQCWRTSLQINPNSIANQSGLLFHLNYRAGPSNPGYIEEAIKFGRMVTSRIEQALDSWLCEPHPQRLRVGLVSGDFRNHPVGHFLHGLLREIGITQLDLIAYTTQPGVDDFSKRIRPYFADWTNIGNLSDKAAAAVIRADGIHVLIDLAGHSSHNRLPLFAWKAAPIQISWLGYLASTGLESIDYVLSDPYAIEAADEKYFTEKIWRLPDSCICFTPTVDDVPINAPPSLEQGFVTFGSFNNLSKMTDDVIEIWSQILLAVPKSRLFLKASQLNEPAIAERILNRYASHGISADRLLLSQTVAAPEQHLATYNRIDIALDTFPYPGVTTSVEALWMGVPVLTLRGDGILARANESININASLTEWIASDKSAYIQKAILFAENPANLADLRKALRSRILASPLFDSIAFARNFNDALWDIWKKHNKRVTSE